MVKRASRRPVILKEDEVLTLAQRLIELAKLHRKWLILAGSFLLVILVGVSAVSYHKALRQDQAEAALTRLRPKLANPAEAETALQGLARLVKDYPNTATALEAELFRAHLLYQTGKFAEAARAYEALQQSPLGSSPGFSQLIADSLSYCYEAMGDFPKAVAVIRDLPDKTSGVYQSEVLFRLGWLSEKAGNPKEASQFWRRLLMVTTNPVMIPYLKEKLGEEGAESQ